MLRVFTVSQMVNRKKQAEREREKGKFASDQLGREVAGAPG